MESLSISYKPVKKKFFTFISSNNADHEVSPWYLLDWVGWKLISWDMDTDGLGEWIGDGNLGGNIKFDSFQLSHVEGQSQFGKIYIDDLRIVNHLDLSLLDYPDLPINMKLGGNYPNPFNISTEIFFSIDKQRPIKLSIHDLIGNKVIDLIKDTYSPGQYKVKWDSKNDHGNYVSSGIYIYTITSNDYHQSKRMILLK